MVGKQPLRRHALGSWIPGSRTPRTGVDALRAGAKQIREARDTAAPGSAAPVQLERRAAVLEAEAAAIRQSQASATALYNVLSAEQKQAADLLMADHLGRM